MRNSAVLLWGSMAVAPLAWFLSLWANFAIAALACGGQVRIGLCIVSVIALILTGLGAFVCWSRHTNLGKVGMALNVLFGLAILAQAIPNLMMGGCE